MAAPRTVVRILARVGLAGLGLVAIASGEPLGKWRTPDGSLWFGNDPPPGSTRIGDVTPLEPLDGADAAKVPPGEAPPAAAEADAAREGREIMRRRAEERAAARARRQALRHAVVMATQSVTRGNLGWVIVGSVRNTAPETVHDVRVGAGGVWVSTEPPRLAPGGEGTFQLHVDAYPYTEYDAVPPVEIDWKERR